MSLEVNISEPDEFNCVELHSCIENVARMYEIKDFTYHVELACGKCENFIANVFRVTIVDTNDSDKKTSVIVKTLVNTTRQELFHELHKREVKAYVEVISKYQTLQTKLGDDKVILPNCILTDATKGKEVIILDDLVSVGYECDNKLNKLINLDQKQVCTILAELAKFHALSIVFEYDDPENFKNLKNEFNDLIFQESFLNKSKLRDYFNDSLENSINLITDVETKSKLDCVKVKLIDILRIFTSPRKFNVLCHGDCWENKTDICLLDFQAMRYCNPATDIVYFLYLSTDSKFRSLYMQTFLSAYFDSFSSFLKLNDIDTSTVYPQETLEADVKDMLPYGFLMALVELRIVTTTDIDKDTSNEVDLEIDSNVENKYDDEMLKVRVNDVVQEAKVNGTIDAIFDLLKTVK
ncbi:uncharacterized protein [Battus philenor]|uniref:uncharacterized protein n=1 Tax=Battus philenor TaxID=42288 RepID=UPI0035CF47BF